MVTCGHGRRTLASIRRRTGAPSDCGGVVTRRRAERGAELVSRRDEPAVRPRRDGGMAGEEPRSDRADLQLLSQPDPEASYRWARMRWNWGSCHSRSTRRRTPPPGSGATSGVTRSAVYVFTTTRRPGFRWARSAGRGCRAGLPAPCHTIMEFPPGLGDARQGLHRAGDGWDQELAAAAIRPGVPLGVDAERDASCRLLVQVIVKRPSAAKAPPGDCC